MSRLVAILSVLFSCGLIVDARAESTRFYCSTEEAAEHVAHGIVINRETLDKAVVPMIQNGTCFWSAAEIEILVLRKGKVFTSNDDGVFVASFMLNGKNDGRREYYALIRYIAH